MVDGLSQRAKLEGRPLVLQISDIKTMLATGNYTGTRKLALQDELDELEDLLGRKAMVCTPGPNGIGCQ